MTATSTRCDECDWDAHALAMSAEEFDLQQDDRGMLTCAHCRTARGRREYAREPELNTER